MNGKYVKGESPCGERKSLAVIYLDWFNQKTKQLIPWKKCTPEPQESVHRTLTCPPGRYPSSPVWVSGQHTDGHKEFLKPFAQNLLAHLNYVWNSHSHNRIVSKIWCSVVSICLLLFLFDETHPCLSFLMFALCLSQEKRGGGGLWHKPYISLC